MKRTKRKLPIEQQGRKRSRAGQPALIERTKAPASARLRRRAEARLQRHGRRRKPEAGRQGGGADTQQLVHELQVHQIELEMQNEELCRAHRELEVSREKYFDLYELAPVGYLTLNKPGLILEANLTAANLLGVARSKLLQQPLHRFVLREDLGVFNQHRQRLFETRASQDCELRLTRPSGAPFWVRGEAILAQDNGTGAPVCRMTLSDLTERKQAEADRDHLAHFERLAQLMKCANDSILLTDAHGRILEANDRALALHGYSLAEMRQKTLKDLRAPESRSELSHQTEQLETDGRSVFEAMHQHRNGTPFPVEVSARYLEIAGVRYQLSIVRDISVRKRAEEALHESELFVRNVLDSLTTHIAALDAHGVIIAVNEAWKRFARENGGADTAAYLGANYLAVCEESFRRGKDESVAAALRGLRAVMNREQDGFSLEYPCHSINERRWFNLQATHFPGEGLVRLVVAHENITERKQAEERMRMFSQEIIVAREKERKQVSSVLHHNVGSLAVGISAHLDAIEQEVRSGKPGQALEWTKRTRKLFNDTVVRLKKLAIELRPPELDVLGLRAALRQHFAQVTEGGRTRIHFRERLGGKRVPGDAATMLFRMAQEALTNAITHGGAKQVNVDVRALKEDITLTVHDNGKEFDPAKQMVRPTSQMGLRVMREMAISVGGVFTVKSGRGKGTTVRVRLPLSRRPRMNPAQPT